MAKSGKPSLRQTKTPLGADRTRRKRKGRASQYRMPKEAQELQKLKRYLAFQSPRPILNQVTADLHLPTRCGTILGGDKVWLWGERKNGDKYRFPVIVGGRKCTNPASHNTSKDGKTIRRCSEHIGIEWIPDKKAKEAA